MRSEYSNDAWKDDMTNMMMSVMITGVIAVTIMMVITLKAMMIMIVMTMTSTIILLMILMVMMILSTETAQGHRVLKWRMDKSWR